MAERSIVRWQQRRDGAAGAVFDEPQVLGLGFVVKHLQIIETTMDVRLSAAPRAVVAAAGRVSRLARSAGRARVAQESPGTGSPLRATTLGRPGARASPLVLDILIGALIAALAYVVLRRFL